MAKIKVTRGGCGIVYTDANGNVRHTLKTPENGPFECGDEQAARLVGLGVAEYVDADVKQEGQTGGSQETEKATGHLDAEQLAEMDYNGLKKLAADMGVKPDGKTKADYIAAIVAAEVELDDGDELPELNAADPE